MIAKFIGLGLAAGALAGCSTLYDDPETTLGEANLVLASGVPVGKAQLIRQGDRLSIGVAVTGLAPGSHGFHLHETGSCRAPDFTSAGGHLNPTNRAHGHLASRGSHFGDLRNLEVGNSRSASTVEQLPGDAEQALRWLFDGDGTALVIHAGPDDYRSDPSGAAGARVACGVLKRD